MPVSAPRTRTFWLTIVVFCNRPHDAFGKTEVHHGLGDLAVLDQKQAITGEASELDRLRIHRTDVPETGYQQTSLGRTDQVCQGELLPSRTRLVRCLRRLLARFLAQ